jgi:hypothetical protein
MSKIISLFNDSDKLEGSKNYKAWSRHIQSTLIYNELWKGICNEQPTKPTDVVPLARWELKDENALALIQSTVSDEVFVHIENCIDSWSAWKILKDLFDSQTEAKRVDLQLNLLQQKLVVGGDVMEYISRLKNIKQEISKASFAKIEDSLMVTILISVCQNHTRISWKHCRLQISWII